jgi:hypothetical protein
MKPVRESMCFKVGGHAEAAHGVHEKSLGHRDENWSEWYAEYMAAEQAGTELPQ